MTQLANEASSSVESSTPVVAEAVKPVQRWLGHLKPVIERATGTMKATQSAVEKRLGFCPGKEAMKAASRGLDALADGLHAAAKRLRAVAQIAPGAGDDAAGPASTPQAQA
jgi:hypothetical protein